jgi:hypothetical protein
VKVNLDIEDSAALLGYLRAEGRLGVDEEPHIEVLAGGVSCRTVRVDRPGGESWVLKQALPRLRVEVEWLSDPARIHREALGMEWLVKLTPPGSVASLVFEDERHDLVAMEAVPLPHEQWKAMMLAGRLVDDHVRQFGSLLASIHRGAAAIPELAVIFADRSFYETLRLEPYYEYSATREPAASAFLLDLVAVTRRNPNTLVHGDYSPKNVLVRDGSLVLLDHEVIHWGDGAFDIGFGMTHLLAKALHVAGKRERFLSAAHLFWDTYRTEVGGVFARADYEARAARHVIACVLARAVGRSKLEYLSDAELRLQANLALSLAADPPATVGGVIAGFGAALGPEAI